MGNYFSLFAASASQDVADAPASSCPPSFSHQLPCNLDDDWLEQGAPLSLSASSACAPSLHSCTTDAPASSSFLSIHNLVHQTVIYEPSSVQGRPISIAACQHCSIYVLDHCGPVAIADCTDCRIVVGVSEGSVVVTNSARYVGWWGCVGRRMHDVLISLSPPQMMAGVP